MLNEREVEYRNVEASETFATEQQIAAEPKMPGWFASLC